MTSSIPYIHDTENHNKRAARIVLPEVMRIHPFKSVIDVGCGLGTWAAVAKELGAEKIVGVDGDYVNRTLLEISDEEFVSHDLTKKYESSEKFDLAICLEVGEHLPETSARDLVATLTHHADTILFSAAIIGQDGYKHINEQYYPYWQKLFAEKGYRFYDVLRARFWWNEQVDVWYRQNMFIVSKQEFHYNEDGLITGFHPQIFHGVKNQYQQLKDGKAGLKASLSVLVNAVKVKLGLK
jgi:predicted RNA methylase